MGANSYNICPRCGNSNALSAKYCSRCGGQLKVPEEPVVCPKCHTHNSSLSNFCRNCGTELKVGWETKICPKCGKELDAHQNVCSCGYSFVTMQQTAPAPAPLPTATPSSAAPSVKKGKTVYSHKGARVWAIVTLVFLLLFAYYIVAPTQLLNTVLRPAALNNIDKGIVSENGMFLYGGNYLYKLFYGIKGGNFASEGAATVIMEILVAETALVMAVQLIVCIVRCIVGKRPKRMGWFHFVMFFLSLVVVGLVVLFNSIEIKTAFLQKIASPFRLPDGCKPGYAIWAIPVFYLIFSLLFFCSRAKKLNEKR